MARIAEPPIKSSPRRRGFSNDLSILGSRLRGNDKTILIESFPRPSWRRSTQRGQVLLGIVFILAIVFGALFYNFVSPSSSTIERDKITAAALAQAKEALIGYAAKDTNRPGSLPCPDLITNNIPFNNIPNDGSADSYSGSDCPSYIGRLPWRTLGLPDLRDGSGERLWYAVSREFSRNPSCGSTCPLNSDTKGTLTITGTSPATDVIAVIFAPGSVVGTQVRDTANENNVANYLDGGNETGIATSTFITGSVTATFNDRPLIITGADVMTLVERRAASEILQLLKDYRSGNGGDGCSCYPWADSDWDGIANSGTRYGGIPLMGASPKDWSPAAGYNPSPWLTSNQWYKVIYYAVSLRDSGTGSGGDPRFTVDTTTNRRVVLITSGPAIAGDGRPISDWTNYVQDNENRNNDNAFCNPGPSAVAPCTPTNTYGRNRLYKLP